jgi:hypothetical protein
MDTIWCHQILVFMVTTQHIYKEGLQRPPPVRSASYEPGIESFRRQKDPRAKWRSIGVRNKVVRLSRPPRRDHGGFIGSFPTTARHTPPAFPISTSTKPFISELRDIYNGVADSCGRQGAGGGSG